MVFKKKVIPQEEVEVPQDIEKQMDESINNLKNSVQEKHDLPPLPPTPSHKREEEPVEKKEEEPLKPLVREYVRQNNRDVSTSFSNVSMKKRTITQIIVGDQVIHQDITDKDVKGSININ